MIRQGRGSGNQGNGTTMINIRCLLVLGPLALLGRARAILLRRGYRRRRLIRAGALIVARCRVCLVLGHGQREASARWRLGMIPQLLLLLSLLALTRRRACLGRCRACRLRVAHPETF